MGEIERAELYHAILDRKLESDSSGTCPHCHSGMALNNIYLEKYLEGVSGGLDPIHQMAAGNFEPESVHPGTGCKSGLSLGNSFPL